MLTNLGLQFSYGGTIGILLFQRKFLFWWGRKKKRKRKKTFHFLEKRQNQIKQKMQETLAVTFSAQIVIFPLMIYHFNVFSIYFVLTNLLVSFLLGPIMLLAFLFLICCFFSKTGCFLLAYILEKLLFIFLLITKIGKLPFSKIYLPTPSLIQLIFYFVCLFFFFILCFCFITKKENLTQRRVRNLVALFRYRFFLKRKLYLKMILLFFFLLFSLSFLPKNLRIYFVDVGQGDCTLIKTPTNQTILIDGGGSLSKQFDVGKNTVIPYLLDRGITNLDQVYISHFDQDHVGRFTNNYRRNKSKKCNYRETI